MFLTGMGGSLSHLKINNMQLIRKLGTRVINNRIESWGLFLCPYCFQEIEKELIHGKRDKSCGCMKKEFGKINKNALKHGEVKTRLYSIWGNMKNRCSNPNSQAYKYYGGRGITICNEWLEFIPFRDWSLSNGYTDILEIDRKENDKGYYPENCRWTSETEQSRNRKCIKLNMRKAIKIRILYKTGNYTQKRLSDIFNVSIATVSYIIN